MLCYLLLVVVCSTWLTVTTDQVSTAATLKKIVEFDELIDETVNPCDDFQKYVCSRQKVLFATELQLKINQIVTNRIITGVRLSDQEAVKKFYDFIGKCTAKFDTHNASLHRLLEDLESVFKNQSGDYHPFDSTLIAKLTAFLNSRLINFFVQIDYHKPHSKTSRWFSNKEKILHFDEFQFSQDRRSYAPNILPYMRDQLIQEFQAGVAAAFPTKTAFEVNETASQFFKFEEETSKLLPYPEETALEKTKRLKEVTVGEAMVRYPGLDWKTYITSLSNYSGIDFLKDYKLEDFPLVINVPDVVKALPRIVKLMPEETLRDYIRFRVVSEFDGLFNMASEPGSCIQVSLLLFDYVKQYFLITDMLPTPEDRVEFKKSLGKLADDVVGSAIDMLEGISWIKNDNQTFAGFTDKINKLKKVIGFPDEFANQTWLDEQYKDFILDDADDLYSYYLKGTKFMFKQHIKDILGLSSVVESNAGLYPHKNKFQINIGIVGDVDYHPDYLPGLNYGSLGTIIGHEILHDFDNEGSEYDADGYINPWMSAESKVKLDSMAQCVIDAYDKFNATDAMGKVTPVNGTLTLGENLSDIGGIRAAYMAFKNNPAHMQPFPKTKKLKKYTQEQLFFLAFARTFCGPLQNTFIDIIKDVHSPLEIRILGTLQNFVPFRKAFNCPANSVYAPEKHCEIYTPDLKSGVSLLIPSFILLAIIAFTIS